VDVVDDQAPEPLVIADADIISAVASGHFDRLRAADVAGETAVGIASGETPARAAELLANRG
jgi:hypothetical protein